jgi:hypothetical protein
VRKEHVMKSTVVAAAIVVGMVIGFSGLAWTQTGQALPVPSVGAARDVPGGHELPDPTIDYKVVFSVSQAGKPGEINPTLQAMARYLNTLAKNGVAASHRHIAAVFHQALFGKKIDPGMVLPDIPIDLWAMTTMVNLQMRGYARIGG